MKLPVVFVHHMDGLITVPIMNWFKNSRKKLSMWSIVWSVAMSLSIIACNSATPLPMQSIPTPTGRIYELTRLTPEGASPSFEGRYRIYIPNGDTPLRGVIIRQHGCGNNGIALAQDLHWQAFAKKWDMAVLGTHYPTDCDNWAYPERGSFKMLEQALKDFADRSDHPELSTAPWALWGHSGGANWTYFLTQQVPERIIANVSRSGSEGQLPETARNVPQLLSAGKLEETSSNQGFVGAYFEAVNAFKNERTKGALVSLSIDPIEEHGLGWGRFLAMAYFDGVFAQRLPEQNGQPLKNVDSSQAWLGNPETLEIASASTYEGDANQAAWFPSETVARRWQEFDRTGTITDTTPPPAPSEPRASRIDQAVRLTWQGGIDFETGIQAFKIYRNGELIKQLGDENNSFQRPDGGDGPSPQDVELAFDDPSSPKDAEYQISAVNHKGLESEKSDVVKAP
jgi:hypothetical protein